MEILVSKIDQNPVSLFSDRIAFQPRSTELATRLMSQAGSHPPLSTHTFRQEGPLSPLSISMLGERETGHGKDTSEQVDRGRAGGTENS